MSDEPHEDVYDKIENKLIGIFRKIKGDTPYVGSYGRNVNKLDGVYYGVFSYYYFNIIFNMRKRSYYCAKMLSKIDRPYSLCPWL